MGTTDVGVGDVEVPHLDVTPADNTTVAALTVHRPDGTTDTLTATGGALDPIPDSALFSQRWTANSPVVYDQPGRWVLHWTVTGTGAGTEDVEVYVVASPVAGGPAWLPGRSRVANYVPGRTLSIDASTHELTFSSTTRPTGLMVDRLIADAATRITGVVATVHPTLEAQAAVLTAMWAAASVERGFPDDEQNQLSLQRANDLEKRADLMLAELITANESLTGTQPYPIAAAARWSFPPADCRWDNANYW